MVLIGSLGYVRTERCIFMPIFVCMNVVLYMRAQVVGVCDTMLHLIIRLMESPLQNCSKPKPL